MRAVVFVLGLSQCPAYILRTAIPPRASVISMEQPGPFSTDCVHVLDATLGDGRPPCRLALMRVPDDRRATLALWRHAYEYELGGDAGRLARADAELRATMALCTGPSSMTFGGYLDGLDGEEDAIALVRVEEASKVMIIDALLVSPARPTPVRPALHAFVVQSLRAIGASEGMSVRLWTDFDV